jgi:hypothetical protein
MTPEDFNAPQADADGPAVPADDAGATLPLFDTAGAGETLEWPAGVERAVRATAAALGAKHPAAAVNEYGRCVAAGYHVAAGSGDWARVHHQLPPIDLTDPERPGIDERHQEQRDRVDAYARTLEAAGFAVAKVTVLTGPILRAMPLRDALEAHGGYPGRHRVKGGRNVHATRMVPRDGRGVQTPACGESGKPMVPMGRTTQVTCPDCRFALGLPEGDQ